MERVHRIRKYDRTIISHKLKKTEQISRMEMDIINKGEIPGLLPIRLENRFWGRWICYEVREMIDLGTYLKSGISVEEFFDAVMQMLRLFLNCQAFGINTQNIELNHQCVFFRRKNRTVYMLYWPIITMGGRDNERRFFHSVGKAYACPPGSEQQKWRRRYLQLFTGRERHDTIRFRQQVEELVREWKELNEQPYQLPGTHTTVLGVPFLVEQGTKRIIKLSHFPFVIGRRASNCDYVVKNNLYVGREHIAFLKKNDRIYLHDCGSQNGTEVNGRKIEKNGDVLLKSGSRIVLSGMMEFVFYSSGDIAR